MKFVVPAVRNWTREVPWERKSTCRTDVSTVHAGCRPHADDIRRVHRLVTTPGQVPGLQDRLGLCWEYWTMPERPALLSVLSKDWSTAVVSQSAPQLALLLEIESGSLLAYMVAVQDDVAVYRPLDWCLELVDRAQAAVRHLYLLREVDLEDVDDLDLGIMNAWLRDVSVS